LVKPSYLLPVVEFITRSNTIVSQIAFFTLLQSAGILSTTVSARSYFILLLICTLMWSRVKLGDNDACDYFLYLMSE